MKRFSLISFATALALTSGMAANIELASDLKLTGDAQVQAISVKGDTDTVKKDKQVFDSEINLI